MTEEHELEPVTVRDELAEYLDAQWDIYGHSGDLYSGYDYSDPIDE